jgi:predicted DNA-binding antitoxin AbrB/MazE fold protein
LGRWGFTGLHHRVRQKNFDEILFVFSRLVACAATGKIIWVDSCIRPGDSGAKAMTMTVQAVYEDGVLKPTQTLPLREHEHVTLTIQSATSVARQTAGMVPWTGDVETLERLTRDPEFGIRESP